MIEFLDHIDKHWLLALNNDFSNFWDGIMFGFSERITWIPLYLSIIYIVIRRWKSHAWIIIVSLILCIVISDQIASGVIKNFVHRLRPSHDPEIQNLIVLVHDMRGGMFGFVSSHAANSFGLALLSSLLFRNRYYTVSIFTWAIINSYSRIYLGLHYPFDVLGGALVGVFSALLIYWLLKKFIPPLLTEKYMPLHQYLIPYWIFMLTCLGLVAYSIWWF